jgi:competence protein ComEC
MGVLVARSLVGRGSAAAVLALSLGLWTMAERPALLVSGDGTLAGLMTKAGRVISKEKGGGFIAQSWLEDDGDLSEQAEAYARAGFDGPKGARQAMLGSTPVLLYAGKGAADRASEACAGGAIVILSEDWAGRDDGDCLLFDRQKLRQTGALAIFGSGTARLVVATRDWAGARLWNSRATRSRTGD